MKNIHKTGPQGNVRVQEQLGMTFGCFVGLMGAICMVSRQGDPCRGSYSNDVHPSYRGIR